MHRSAVLCLALSLSIVLACSQNVFAQKKGGGGKGGGGNSAPYKIVDLPGIPTTNSRGQVLNQSYAKKVSNSDHGTVYVLGSWGIQGLVGSSGDCLWAITEDGTVSLSDLTGNADYYEDVNSAGIVSGELHGRPVIVPTGGNAIFLEHEAIQGKAFGMNDPDDQGVFQVVGYLDGLPPEPVMWNVQANGTVLSRTVLQAADGLRFFPHDISNSMFLGGYVVSTEGVFVSPAIAVLTETNQLLTSYCEFPVGVDGAYDYEIDEVGNLLANGYQLGNIGTYARAVIWPIGSGAIDVTSQQGLLVSEGNGISTVNGVMQAVGGANDNRSYFAFLYANGNLFDLNGLAQGESSWTLKRADDINSSGMICGYGRVGSKRNFDEHAFLLIPNTH